MTQPSRQEIDKIKKRARIICKQRGIITPDRQDEFISWLLERYVTQGPTDSKFAGRRFVDWTREHRGRTESANRKRVTFVHYEDLQETDRDEDHEDQSVESMQTVPHAAIEMEQSENFEAMVKDLPERHRVVLWLYFYFGARLLEIGRILNVTEARAYQIVKEGLAKIKNQK